MFTGTRPNLGLNPTVLETSVYLTRARQSTVNVASEILGGLRSINLGEIGGKSRESHW
jgi:hypothetical protein